MRSRSSKPTLRLVRPALEIAQPIVPAGKSKPGAGRSSYSDEILRIALDRMISHAANELLDDATRPFFEDGSAAAEKSATVDGESAVFGVIEPKKPGVEMGADGAEFPGRSSAEVDCDSLS